MYVCTHVIICVTLRPRTLREMGGAPRNPAPIGTGLMGTYLNGYLALQRNIPSRTAQFKQFLELLARKRLGTHWAKYPFSRCRS